MNSSSLSHTRWKCQYQIVFIPKYRRKAIYGQLRNDVREILKKLCEYKKVEIVEGAVCPEHVHLYINTTKAKRIGFYGISKSKSALMVYDKNLQLASK